MDKASGGKQLRDQGEKRDISASPKAAGFRRPVGIGKAMVALSLIILLALGIAVFKRNSTWKDEITLWKDVAGNSAYKARGHNNLGLVYDGFDRADEAIEEFQKAIRLKSDYAPAHNNLGTVYYGLGRADEAIEEYQKAIRLKPGYALAHNNLGLVYGKLGRVDEAIEEFRKAIRLSPGMWQAYYNLGLAYEKKGLKEEALKEYEEALRIKPDFTEARPALDRLRVKP